MVEYERHIIDVNYKGHHYTRLTDLSEATGIPAQKLNHRWVNGIRDVDRLTYQGHLPIVHNGPIEISYKGHRFSSLKEFARAYDVGYNRLRALYKAGVHDPEQLVVQAQRKDVPKILKQIVKDDYRSGDTHLNEEGLLSLRQVSKATGISRQALTELTARVERGQTNNSGLLRSDIVNMNRENAHPDTVNTFTMQKRAFRPSAIKHLLDKKKDKSNLEPIPFDGVNYLYDRQSRTVYSYKPKSHALKRLTENPKNIYTLRDEAGRRYTFRIDDVEDLIDNPEITADQLITKADILSKLDGTNSMWNSRGFIRYLNNGNSHSRYNSQRKKVTGWLPQVVKSVKDEHPDLFEQNKTRRTR